MQFKRKTMKILLCLLFITCALSGCMLIPLIQNASPPGTEEPSRNSASSPPRASSFPVTMNPQSTAEATSEKTASGPLATRARPNVGPLATPTPYPDDYIRILVGNTVYKEVTFGEPQTITVDQGNGMVNEIEITEDQVRMAYATCPDQLCIHQQEITRENYDTHSMFGFIVCMPNQVTIEAVMKE